VIGVDGGVSRRQPFPGLVGAALHAPPQRGGSENAQGGGDGDHEGSTLSSGPETEQREELGGGDAAYHPLWIRNSLRDLETV